MSHDRSSLAVLRVAEPCKQSWSRMTGGTESRFCTHCQKRVYNLSAMTSDNAEKLICESAGSLCVRFKATKDGRPITLDYEPPARWKWKIWPISIAATTGALLAGIVVFTSKPTRTMGAMYPMPRATTQASTSAPVTTTQLPAVSAPVTQGR